MIELQQFESAHDEVGRRAHFAGACGHDLFSRFTQAPHFVNEKTCEKGTENGASPVLTIGTSAASYRLGVGDGAPLQIQNKGGIYPLKK